MRSHLRSGLLLAVLMATTTSAAVKFDDRPMFPEAVDQGGTFGVTGSEFTTPISGDLYDTAGKRTSLDPPTLDAEKKVITFRLPRDIEPGRYFLKLSVGKLKVIGQTASFRGH